MSALVITTNYGIEQDELTVPVKALRDAGIDVTIAAVSTDDIRTLVGDEKPGESVTPDTTTTVKIPLTVAADAFLGTSMVTVTAPDMALSGANSVQLTIRPTRTAIGTVNGETGVAASDSVVMQVVGS